MSFRFDRQHLTGQQKAIATQRDRTSEAIGKTQPTKSKVQEMVEFIGENQIFDLVITRHEPEQSGYGNHNSMQVVIDGGGYVSIPELSFKGVLAEEVIESVGEKQAKMKFNDSGNPIQLSIIKRHV
ncbi:hypothetical protein [Paenibacillus sp. HW567]|uniref:hypothetical protein n=1 Tax=Paenibacillus sp. HW567 TaxID=1034769 RepID=UPI0003715448|nr:hypothetical protein [Paenibacillus sp. HW567]